MKKLLALSIIFLFFGCKSAMKASYGIHKPKIEDQHSIKKYLTKSKIDTANVFVFRNLYAYSMASKMKMLIVPDAMFFDSKGYLMPYKEEATTCNANVGKFITDLQNMSASNTTEGRRLDDLLTMIESTNHTEVAKNEISVFITWAKFVGKLNRTKAFEWIDLLDKVKAQGVKVNYYLLNCDFQKSWDIPKDKKEKLGIKS